MKRAVKNENILFLESRILSDNEWPIIIIQAVNKKQ